MEMCIRDRSFSKPDVKAYVDGNVQRTENIQFNASSQQKITMDLPKGVKLHNVSTGTVSAVSYTHLDVYKRQVQALHGQVVRVSPVSDQYINPMDLNLNYSEEDNPLSLKMCIRDSLSAGVQV